MDNKLSELKAAAAKYSVALNAHRENPKDADAVVAWDEATWEMSRLINNDEVNIIVAMLAKLEANAQCITGLERHVKDIEATLIVAADEVADLTKERDEALARLATPVRLPGSFYPDGDIDFPLVVELDEAVEAIRTAGFNVERDEQ